MKKIIACIIYFILITRSLGVVPEVKTNLIDSMSLREKIAQMIISSVIPENFSDRNENSSEMLRLKRLCSEEKIGGLIFFKGSIDDYVWLSNKLQSFAETPLLISADFERGIKMRVTDGVIFPNNMAIGAAGNYELCYRMGSEIARQMKILGVHQNYSPVCDVNNNPDNPIINVRSFGEEPELVSVMSEAMIKGLQDGGVIATAKHFPGHGDTDIDSHKDLPVLKFPMDRLENIELVPFRNAVKNGVKSVMIAHLSFPELESNMQIPASLSANIVQNLLIDKIGFNGLVVTDALNMKGITKYYSVPEVALMCVKAGIDLILMPLDEKKTIDAIESAVKNGIISEERINHSAKKILDAKKNLGLFEKRHNYSENPYSEIHSAEAYEIASRLADESITLVKDEYNNLPIKQENKKTAIVIISEGGESDNTSYLINNYSEYIHEADLNPAPALYKDYDMIIIAVYAKVRFGTGRISLSRENVDKIKKIFSRNKNTVVISFGNPYLLKEFPEIPAYICAYGDQDISIISALKALTGKIPFKGKLPVSLCDNYKRGWGIIR